MSKKKRNNSFYQPIDLLIKGMKKRGMSTEEIHSEIQGMIDGFKISEIEKSLIKSRLELITPSEFEDIFFQLIETMEENRNSIADTDKTIKDIDKKVEAINSRIESIEEEIRRKRAEISELKEEAKILTKEAEEKKKNKANFQAQQAELKGYEAELDKEITAIVDSSFSFSTLLSHALNFIVTTEREAIEAPILRMVAKIESPHFVDESFIQYLHDNLSPAEMIHIDRIIKMLAVIVDVYESGVNYVIDVSSEMEENIKPFLSKKGIPMQRGID